MAKAVDRSLAAYLRGRFERPSGPKDDFSLRDRKTLVISTSLMKSFGAVNRGRDSGSRPAELWPWIEAALNSSRFASLVTFQGPRSSVSSFKTPHVSLGVLGVNSLVVMRELIRPISPLIRLVI